MQSNYGQVRIFYLESNQSKMNITLQSSIANANTIIAAINV